MKLKERIKTYNFWVSLISALFLIVNIVGQKFNFHLDEVIFSDLLTTLCGILVLLGIIAPATPQKQEDKLINTIINKDTTQENTKECEDYVATTKENINEPNGFEQLSFNFDKEDNIDILLPIQNESESVVNKSDSQEISEEKFNESSKDQASFNNLAIEDGFIFVGKSKVAKSVDISNKTLNQNTTCLNESNDIEI